MASDFLKGMAAQTRKRAEEYRSASTGASGGQQSTQRQSATASTGRPALGSKKEEGNTTPSSPLSTGTRRSSSFLRDMATRSREHIDKEYGADAYGGSNYRFGVGRNVEGEIGDLRSKQDYAEMVEKGRAYKETGFRLSMPDNGIVDAFMGGISAKSALQYMNDPEYAMSERMREQSGPIPENRFSKLDYLTDEERETIYYHAGREEWSDINKYLDDLDTELNQRDQEKVSQQTAEQTAKHPVLGTGLNIASSLLSPLSYVDAAGQTIKNAITGEEKPLDTNTPLYRFANTTRDTQEALTEKARDAAGGDGLGADIAGFAAGTGLSIGQNVARLPMGAVAGLVDMAMGAAAGQSIDVTERGANSGTAMLESTAVGAVEYLTEKLPFERLFRLAKNSPVSAGEVVRNILGQVFLEGGEEVVSEVAGNLIDRAIMGDSSSYELYVQSLLEQGLSEDEARKEATRQFYVENVAVAFAGGAVSGGVMGGGATIAGYAGNTAQNAQTGGDFRSMGPDVVQAIIDEGLQSDPSTQSYKRSSTLKEKMDAGKTVSDASLGRLYRANVEAIDAESAAEGTAEIRARLTEAGVGDGAAQQQAEAIRMVLDGQEVSGKKAAVIATSEQATKLLSELTGQSIQTDAPLSAIKHAIQGLASHATDTTKGAGIVSRPAQFEAQRPAPTIGRPIAEQAHSIKRIAQIASTMGENGGKALNAAYDGAGDVATFYGGFSQYYEAGMTGRSMGKVGNDYGLTDAQMLAAHSAGQNDATASLAAQKDGRAFATVYGKEGGFIPNEHATAVSDADAKYYNLLGRATGTKVMMAAPTGEGGANGWYRGGELHIAADANSPGMVVAKHETTHRLQELAPEAYRKFRDYAINAIADKDGDTNTLVEQCKDRYAEVGVSLTTEEAMDEIAADFTEKLLLDEETIQRFIRDDRTTAQKFFDALRSFLRKVKGLFSHGAKDQAAKNASGLSVEQLEQASKLWLDALKSAEQAVSLSAGEQRAAFSDVNTRYSIREKAPPQKTGTAYKVFLAKDGSLYPPMVANPGGVGTPVGVWLDADVGKTAPPSKTGRAQVQGGGKGTNAGKISLAFRPGWHLGDIPVAKQFGRLNPETGAKELFPADFVWAECEYAMDVDYQEEAMSYG